MWPRSPLLRQTQVHNGPGRNELCNCVMKLEYAGLHLMYSWLHYRVLKRGVYPHADPLSSRLPPRHPMGHPVAESPQHTPDASGHHPHLRHIQQYQLDHYQLYLAQGPGIWTLSSQHPCHSCPLPSCLQQVSDRCWPAVVRCCDNLTEVFVGGDRGEGNTIQLNISYHISKCGGSIEREGKEAALQSLKSHQDHLSAGGICIVRVGP